MISTCIADTPPKRERAAVSRVRRHLEAHVPEQVALKTLANVAHLSAPHLVNAFKQDVGETPGRYGTCLRIQRARVLLLKNLPLAEVALEVGYADQAHFARAFKRLTNATPAAFRQDPHDLNSGQDSQTRSPLSS